MSYGLRVKTVSQELLIDENFSSPAFVGKVTLGSVNTYSIPTSGYVADARSVTVPGGWTYDYMIFWTIPESADNNVYFGLMPRDYVCTSSLSGQLVAYRPSGGGTYTWPEGYVFRLSGFAASSETWGLRVKRPDGSISFDSGLRHLQLKLLQDNFQQTTVSSPVITTTVSGTLPSKPAFMVSTLSKETWTQIGSTLSSNGQGFSCGIRRNGNVLSCLGMKIGTGFEDAPVQGSIDFGQHYGALPIINAAVYD
jgi:hypothetical protein